MEKKPTEMGCRRHSASTMVRALARVARAYHLAQQGDPARHRTWREAYALCPEICDEVAAGRRNGSVPRPGTVQWEEWLDRRTGTTSRWREEILTPAKSKHRGDAAGGRRTVQQVPRRQARGAGHPLRQPVLGPYSHEFLAQRWSAVRGDVSTTVLATLLEVPSNEVQGYARLLDDMLEDRPWRIRVRRGVVQGDVLRDRCDDILAKIAWG